MSAVKVLGPRRGKGGVPLVDWLFWWTLLVLADILFYVVLTPVWLGIRAAAWVADRRARKKTARAAVS